MKKLLLFLFAVLLISCSNSNDGERISQEELSEKMIGAWQITKITYDLEDGGANTVDTGCPTFNTIRFSPDGTFLIEDYEGNSSDINDCYESIFEGLWILEEDPGNSNNNFKIKTLKLDGSVHSDDWDYAELVISGNNMIIIYTGENRKTTENYRKIL